MFGNKYLFINIVKKITPHTHTHTQHKRATEVNSATSGNHITDRIAKEKNKETERERFGLDRTRHEYRPVNPAVTRRVRLASCHVTAIHSLLFSQRTQTMLQRRKGSGW